MFYFSGVQTKDKRRQRLKKSRKLKTENGRKKSLKSFFEGHSFFDTRTLVKAKEITPLSLKISLFFYLISPQFPTPSTSDGGAAAKININCSWKRNWGIIPPLHHQG